MLTISRYAHRVDRGRSSGQIDSAKIVSAGEFEAVGGFSSVSKVNSEESADREAANWEIGQEGAAGSTTQMRHDEVHLAHSFARTFAQHPHYLLSFPP